MKVLIYGGGAREHALAWKIKQSPLLEKLYLCNPNDGFAELGEIITATGFKEIAEISRQKEINLLIVGPEDPLVNGIVDEFKKEGILCIGPDKKWAMLEGSKSYAKEFMARNNIPTAEYEIVTDIENIYNTLEKFTIPVVLKADGLAAGKGVFIAKTRVEAELMLKEYLEGKYSYASKKVIVEEFLEGSEISLISLWDGTRLKPLIPARDYKRLQEGNKGPNTGGMGSYCPVSLSLEEYKKIEEYVKLLENALIAEKADFTGIIYSGLMMTKDGIKVLEYNMRFGDPETQSILMHLESDLLEIFLKTVNKELNKVGLKWKKGQSFCVVVAADGYPENPVKGGEVKNCQNLCHKHNVTIFYAGVKKEAGKLLANGGRVLSICASGICGQKEIYDAIEDLEYSDKIYRRDIGEVSLFKEVCRRNEGNCDNCGL